MSVKLTFHGAAGCVTGFCAKLETGKATVLIDCGMFQGSKTLKALNYGDFPFDPKSIDAVLLTHAHIDHSGLLPKLMKAGFRGPIYATAATRDLCAVMLADSGGIQESEVRHLNHRNQQRGRPPVEPIYTERDAAKVMRQFSKVKLGVEATVAPGLEAVYWEAGHILGSSSIELMVDTDDGLMRLLFSGDLGPGGRDYAPDPEGPSGVDHLIVESTYGDRDRIAMDDNARRELLAKELNDAHAAGGPVLIPAFAVERAQELLADLLILMDDGRVPRGEIFLDSPLAIEATEVFLQDRPQSLPGPARRRAAEVPADVAGERQHRAAERMAHHPGGQRDVRRGSGAQAPEAPALAAPGDGADLGLPGLRYAGAHPPGRRQRGVHPGRADPGPRAGALARGLFGPCRRQRP